MKNPAYIFVLNCGSSSIKFALIGPISKEALLTGLVEKISQPECQMQWQVETERFQAATPSADIEAALHQIWTCVKNVLGGAEEKILGVGHRVVHGGEHFQHSARIDAAVIDAIEKCIPLAPLHNPANLAGIRALKKLCPQLPQVAVFDTAFHQSLPAKAYRYAVPQFLYQHHAVRRYGFHGTSHRYVANQALNRLNLDVADHALISAHLGNGCSITAIKNGKSMDTSMGMTPLEGLVMGTRCGDIDAGVLFYLLEQGLYTAESLDALLNKQSGLLGVSGLSMDMRDLNAAATAGNVDAELAIEVFCYRIAKYIAAYLVPLQRLDALIFTGGIGENDAKVRAKVIAHLAVLKLGLDPLVNANPCKTSNGVISTPESAAVIMVIPTNEELMIALDTHRLIEENQ